MYHNSDIGSRETALSWQLKPLALRLDRWSSSKRVEVDGVALDLLKVAAFEQFRRVGIHASLTMVSHRERIGSVSLTRNGESGHERNSS